MVYNFHLFSSQNQRLVCRTSDYPLPLLNSVLVEFSTKVLYDQMDKTLKQLAH